MVESKHRMGGIVIFVVFAVMFLAVVRAQEGTSNQTVPENTGVQSNEFLNSLSEKKDSPDECY
ncbi:MAG: hypothetical protein ACYSWP_10430, partial [Planctomycetota bacterium]